MSFASLSPHGLQRRQILSAIGATALLGGAPLAQAQTTWKPTAPVRIVIPWPPGGSSDILARFIAPGVSERLGQPVVIENRPGASGSIGSAYVYAAAADGHTLLLGLLDSQSIYPHLTKTSYDATKFVPVAPVGSTAFVLLGRPDLPADNLKELVALAKRQPLSFASAGVGGSPHVMMAAFLKAAKIDDALHVPYTGMAPALQALMGKQVDLMLVAVGGATQLRGKLKFYGVSAAERVAAISDVPTLGELGVPLLGAAWMGVLAPPHTRPAITATLAKALNEVTDTPAYKAKVAELGMSMLTGSPEEFGRFYLDEYRKWGEVVREAAIRLD